MSRMLELRRRALIAALMRKASGLPKGCIELEYIVSTGTQFLKTGFIPNQDTRVVIEYEFIGKVAPNAGAVFGSRIAAFNNAFMFWGYAGSQTEYVKDCYGESELLITPPSGNNAGRMVLDKNKNVTTLNGITITHAANTFTCPSEMLLFATSTAGSFDEQVSAYKIYPCQIYGNGTLARDYVPILDPSGVACMYDKVNKEYCYNAGTGSFIPGYKLPEGYTEREYIESDGTQSINTEFVPNQDTRLVADFTLPEGTTKFLFGSRTSQTEDGFAFFRRYNGYFSDQYNDTTRDTGVAFDTNRHVIDKNKNVTYLDGVAVCTYTAGTFTAPNSLYLFATSEAGKIWYRAIATMYSCQLYDNVTPTRDYVPVTDVYGVACAFDRIGNKTYYSADGGSFIAGPAVAA